MNINQDLVSLFGPRLLVVAAHPDDEAIGCGGLIARLSAMGVEIRVLFLADGETSRNEIEGFDWFSAIEDRLASAEKAREILGYQSNLSLQLSDNRLDDVPLLDLAKEVEKYIDEFDPSFLLTHSGSDLNIDHRACLQASLVATRPVPRQSVRGVASFEVPSSSGWGFASAEPFRPNFFVNIEEFLPQKMRALEVYSKEIPPFPHARSCDSLTALASVRGSHVGIPAAEAFELHRYSL